MRTEESIEWSLIKISEEASSHKGNRGTWQVYRNLESIEK